MIKKIIIKNFQKHIDTEIPCAGFNIIIGDSSAGKSSIFRALAFLFYGIWDKTYPNDNKKNTSVKIILDNNIEIERIRKTTIDDFNIAYIKDSSGTYEFKNFGEQIPFLERIIDLNPITINGKEINLNFSFQDDPLFILSEGAITKAQWLGRLYGANIFSEMLKLAANDKKKLNEELKNIQEEKKEIKKELGKIPNLNYIEIRLIELKQIYEKYQKICNIISKIKEYKENKRKVDKLEKYKNINFNEIYEKLKILEKIKELEDINKKIEEAQNNIIKLNKINSLKENVEKISKIFDLEKEYDIIISKENLLKTEEIDITKQVKILKEEFKKIKNCPFCGNKIDKNLWEKKYGIHIFH